MDELLKLKIFRPINGIRTPYVLTLDGERNVISDLPDTEALQRILNNAYLLDRHRVAVDVVAPAPTASGPSVWGPQFDEWRSSDAPNPFEGTDELREQFHRAVAEVEEQIASGACADCQRDKTIAIYKLKLRELVGS